MIAPLLDIRPLPAVVALQGVASLAFTSRNGVDAFARLCNERSLPVFTVGDATAEAARGHGFNDVRSANGALSDLAGLLAAHAPDDGEVLVAGAREPAGDLPALLAGRVRVRRLPVYEALETGVGTPPAFDAVLVHSPRAARALASRGPFPGKRAIVISAAAAAALGGHSGLEIHIADAPTEAALFEALGKPAPRV